MTTAISAGLNEDTIMKHYHREKSLQTNAPGTTFSS